MPFHKSAYIRYQALDRCFSRPGRGANISQLVDACNKALEPYDQSIEKRQCYNDIKFMKSLDGFDAPIIKETDGGRVYYRYEDANFSIRNAPLSQTESMQLQNAIAVMSRFEGLPQFDWIYEMNQRIGTLEGKSETQQIIAFDSNEDYTGNKYIGPLFNFIHQQKTIALTYQPFNRQADTFNVYPYHLRQYNRRWFLVCKTEGFHTLSVRPLDRIVKIEETEIPYKKIDINWTDYFFDVLGLTIPENIEPLEILIKAFGTQANYIATKPMHHSQFEVEKKEDYSIFRYKLIPNYEFYKVLLSFGERIEVVSPMEVKQTIATKIANMHQIY